jgi:hypothetical protein
VITGVQGGTGDVKYMHISWHVLSLRMLKDKYDFIIHILLYGDKHHNVKSHLSNVDKIKVQ